MTGRSDAPILVLGATGYVGGRLAPRLLERGHRVRAAGRNPNKFAGRSWSDHPGLEIVRADTSDLKSLVGAADGCRAAFYLVHSMISAGKKYRTLDRISAQNMIAAAEATGLEHLIYLGGLGEESAGLSEHLQSRTEVGRILASGKTPATILRAAMILGSGSASFEMLRYLAERLPLMITPRWVHSKVQPITIRNVLDYLIGCVENPATRGRMLDIGGPDVLTYAELFQLYAREAGLPRRLIIPVPFFTPRLSSYWIDLVTPVPASIARPLAEGLKNDVLVGNEDIKGLVPVELISCRSAIRLALEKRRREALETCRLDSQAPPEWPSCEDPDYTGGTELKSEHKVLVDAGPEEVWERIVGLGGSSGWGRLAFLWRLRGLLDRLAGGVGLGRGRRDPSDLRPGDAIGFWRVETLEKPSRLRLRADIKAPGTAYLEYNLTPDPAGRTEVSQASGFHPQGVVGIAYWYSLLPFHNLLFQDLLTSLVRQTGRKVETVRPPSV